MKSKLLLAASFAALLSATGVAAAAVPAYVTSAIADKDRPDTDVKRDAERKPADMLQFAGVKPGMVVVDLIPGQGYFTRIFANAVGPKGVVYSTYSPPRASQDPAKPAPTPAAEAIAAQKEYANVKPLLLTPAKFAVPQKADVVWTSQNYHDLHNIPNFDIAAFNKAVFDSLKPGGEFIVLDHVGAAGDPEETHTVHRIDPAVVKAEVTAAGFKFDGESDVLRNASDDHSKGVFDPSVRGHTDQFIYKFRKPK